MSADPEYLPEILPELTAEESSGADLVLVELDADGLA